MKACTKCNVSKKLTEFYKRGDHSGRLTSECKKCHQAMSWLATKRRSTTPRFKALKFKNELKYRYGITVEQYEAIIAKQKGRCAVCHESFGKRAHLDHNHACCPTSLRGCGKCIRGALCTQCNTALGLLKEDRERIMRLITYLDEFRTTI